MLHKGGDIALEERASVLREAIDALCMVIAQPLTAERDAARRELAGLIEVGDEMSKRLEVRNRELAAAVEPCGICGQAWSEHHGSERFCSEGEYAQTIKGAGKYCPESLWQAQCLNDEVSADLAAAREALRKVQGYCDEAQAWIGRRDWQRAKQHVHTCADVARAALGEEVQ